MINKYSFKVIPRSRLAETVENHIRKLILQGDIKPGDKLPTEEEIGKNGVIVVRSVAARDGRPIEVPQQVR